jgi:hypothetical protein
MTDNSERLAKRKAEEAWPQEQLDQYVAERNAAAMAKIFDKHNPINPITGRPRRKTIVEREDNAHSWLRRGYNPLSAWRTPRREGDL